MILFFKSHVKGHTRRLKDGRVVSVRDYDNGKKKKPDTIPEFIEVGGHRRSSKNSRGSFLGKDVEEIIKFWKWFGGSKIIDNKGRPLVLFHGSDEEFETFDLDRTGSGAWKNKPGLQEREKGVYLTSSLEHAAAYGAEILTVYARMESMVEVDVKSDLDEWAKEGEELGRVVGAQELIDEAYGGSVLDAYNADEKMDSLIKKAKKEGKDGLVVDFGDLIDRDEGDLRLGKIIVALSADQLSKATPL